jgi:hypothetical protein
VTGKRWFKPLVGFLGAVVLFHVWLHFAVTRCLGCEGAELSPPTDGPFPVAIVPGCPSMKDGALSACQWRRAVWATELYESGAVARFVTSGGAVYNRYVEAHAIRAGMASLGVPLDVIDTETQALHTDENLAYSMVIIRAQGLGQVAVASDGAQVTIACAMLRMWGTDCLPLPMNDDWIGQRMAESFPLVRTTPVKESTWLDLGDREAARAKVTGAWARPPSAVVYIWGLFKGILGDGEPPPLAPEGL